MGNSFGSLLNRPGAATNGAAANTADATGPLPIVPTGAGAHQSNAPAAAAGQLAGLPTKQTGLWQRGFNAIGRGNPATNTGGFALTSKSDNRNTGPSETQRITNASQWPTADTLTTLPVNKGSSLTNAGKSAGGVAAAAHFGIERAPVAAQTVVRQPKPLESIQNLFGTGAGTASEAEVALEAAIGNLAREPTRLPAEDVPVLLAALRAATPDVNVALAALTALVGNAGGALSPALGQPVNANGDANAGQVKNAGVTGAALDTAYALRRSLAGSASGMDTLLRLQNVSRPVLQPNPTVNDTNAHLEAEHRVENYTLMLRAESALLNSGLLVTEPRTTEKISAAVRANRDILVADNLGKGNVKALGASGAPRERAAFTENPMTLAGQAFLYANGKVDGPEAPQEDQFKPAYVALRNGFTASGEGSDFNKMITRLAKFPTYVGRASADKGDRLQQFKSTVWNTVAAKNKSPLSNMIETGLLGIDLATVKGQYLADFTKVLDRAKDMLDVPNASPDAARDEKLATLAGWKVELTESKNPFTSGPDGTAIEKLETLKGWVADGSLNTAENAADPEMTRLLASLAGTAPVSDWPQLKDKFDKADAAGRPAVLREVLIRAMNSGDVAEFSDVRGKGGTVSGGASPFGIAVGDNVMGWAIVGELGLEHSKAAVLRAGVASNSGLLFVGTDERWGGSLGAGVRAGVGFTGVGNVGASLMLRGGGSQGTGEGVTIRTRKNGTEFETVALHAAEVPAMVGEAKRPGNWKQMGTEVVDTLFGIHENAKGKPVTPTAMWQQTVDRLGELRDVSFGWTDSSATTGSITAKLEAGGGVGTGNTGLFSANASVGVGTTYKSTRQKSGGAIESAQASQSVVTSANAGAGFSYASTVASTSPQGRALFPPNLQGVRESEFPISGGKGFVRLTSENGVLQPLVSYSEQQFSNLPNFIALVKENEEEWIGAMSPQVEPGGAIATKELARAAGEKALQEFLVDIADQGEKNNRVFIERRSLKPDSAKAITRLQAELQTLKAAQADDKKAGRAPSENLAKDIARLEDAVVSTVNDAASWQPFRLFTNDVTVATTTKSALPGVAPSRGTAGPLSLDSGKTSQQSFGVNLPLKMTTDAKGGRDLATLNAIHKTADANVTATQAIVNGSENDSVASSEPETKADDIPASSEAKGDDIPPPNTEIVFPGRRLEAAL